MSKFAFLGIASILLAAGAAAKAYAEGNEEPAPGGAGDEPEAKRGRGRPKAPETPAGGAGAGGPTDSERFETNRAKIKPLIDNNQGEDVKKVIGKYSKTGLKDLPAASQADFEKDIDALAY